MNALSTIANHVWQSTLFAGVAWLLALALRENRARTRYWIWLAASVKFLLPVSLLVTAGNLVTWRTASRPAVAPVLYQALVPAAAPLHLPTAAPGGGPSRLPLLILMIWALGTLGIAISWLLRWRRMHATVRRARPLNLGLPIRVLASGGRYEPGVFGWWRPILLVPEKMFDRLTPAQANAVLAHELCHARYRDNLTSAIHMLVETLFWFHPLTWWMGNRLLEERERACDEHVLCSTGEPRAYAEGILQICKLYLESPARCVAGVSGANFRRRIETILSGQVGRGLSRGKTLLLVCAGCAAVAAPVAVGVITAPPARAQQTQPKLEFEVASVKINESGQRAYRFNVPPGTRFSATNVTLDQLIISAYHIAPFQLSGGPSWASSTRFDVEAKAPGPGPFDGDQMGSMLQALLADRFAVKLRHEMKELPAYELHVLKTGIKFKEAKCAGEPGPLNPCGGFRLATRGLIQGREAGMAGFASLLTGYLGRPVIDKTNLTGKYNIDLTWTPDETMPHGPGDAGDPAPDLTGPSLFTALQEQLGLRLDATKAPTEVLVLEQAEVPAEN